MSFFQFGILPEYLHILWMRNFVLLRVSMRTFGVHHRCGVGDIWYLPTPTSKWFLFPSTFKLNLLKFIFSIFQMKRGDVREGMRRMEKRRPSHLTVNWCYDLLSWEWGWWKYWLKRLTNDKRIKQCWLKK